MFVGELTIMLKSIAQTREWEYNQLTAAKLCLMNSISLA